MFGEGLELPLENSLLNKLDSGEVFLAGYVRGGNVYLRGDEMGVNGKLIKVINKEITIYDGMCDVSFGWFINITTGFDETTARGNYKTEDNEKLI